MHPPECTGSTVPAPGNTGSRPLSNKRPALEVVAQDRRATRGEIQALDLDDRVDELHAPWAVPRFENERQAPCTRKAATLYETEVDPSPGVGHLRTAAALDRVRRPTDSDHSTRRPADPRIGVATRLIPGYQHRALPCVDGGAVPRNGGSVTNRPARQHSDRDTTRHELQREHLSNEYALSRLTAVSPSATGEASPLNFADLPE